MAEYTILIADPDAALCARIEGALAPYAVRCIAMQDGNEVLAHPLIPSLIVLCIDPKRLGWAICMRIKKHPVLKGVPMIITSAEATEKDFEEHKKLKTRAEEYEHKPVQIERLVEKVRTLLGGLEVQVSGEFEIPTGVEELSADDAVELVEEGEQASEAPGRDRLGSDTDDAFSSIAEPGVAPEADEPAAMAIEVAEAAPEHHEAPAVAEPPAPVRDVIEAAPPAPATPVENKVPTLVDEEPISSEDELIALRQERDRLLHDVEALKARSGGAPTSRELLALREVINRKDKEILELKDSIDARDRDGLGARDRLREAERARRELDERLLSVEKELIGAQEKCEALTHDKEMAHERERGLKGRLDDAHHRLQRLEAEMAEARARHQADVEAAGREAEALRATHAAEKTQLAEARAEEGAAARRAQEEQAAAHEKALAEQRDAAAAEAAQLAVQHQQELARIAGVHATAQKELEERLAGESADRQRHASEAGDLREELARKEQRLAALEDEILKAYHRIKGDETIVARARKALAIALTLLEDSLPKGEENKTS